MKKMLQILVLMLAMWMVFTLVPSAQAAAGDVKVVIDGESRNFNSFDDAIEEADGHTATITLQRTINPMRKVRITSGNITIDMSNHGFNLFSALDSDGRFTPGNIVFEVTGGKLTLKNGSTVIADTSGFLRISGGEVSIEGGFEVWNRIPCRTSQLVMSGGTLNITGGVSFDNTTSLYCDIPALDISGGTVNISNGTYRSRQLYEDPQKEVNKPNTSSLSFNSRTTVNLKGGNFYGISAGAALSNLLDPGYQYDLNGTPTRLENSRYNGSLLSVRYMGYPQEPLVLTTNAETVIRPNKWWHENDKEQYSLSVSGGSSSGKLTAATNADLPMGYLYVGEFGNNTTTSLTVGKPQTKATPVTITVTKAGDSHYMSTSATLNLKLVISLVEDCEVGEAVYSYDGKLHAPNPTITIPRAMVEPTMPGQSVPEGLYEMQAGVDYRLEYTEQSMPGTYTYKVIGLDGILSGEQEFTWTIEPLPFNSDRIQAIMVNPGASTQEAKFIVYDTELETFLYQDLDFLTDYIPHDEPGVHTFRIWGIGAYDGSIEMKWVQPGSIEDTQITVMPAVDEIEPNVTVMYNQNKLVRWVDYTLDWPDITGPGDYTVTVKGTGAWSGEKTMAWHIDFTLDETFYDISVPSCAYTGEPVTPAVTVTGQRESRTLVEGEDYTVAYTNNTEIGTATATITGMGYYTGSISVDFKILDGASVQSFCTEDEEFRYFTSFDDAFDFYYGEGSNYQEPSVSIELLSDQTTEGGRIINGGTLFLHLNGHTLTNIGWNTAIWVSDGFEVDGRGESNLSIYGPGTFESDYSGLVNVGIDGTVFLNYGCKLKTNGTAIQATDPSAFVIVYNATVEAGSSGMYLYGAQASIRDGSFTGNPAIDVYDGTVDIYGGSFVTIDGYGAVYIEGEGNSEAHIVGGEAQIFGGTFTSHNSWDGVGLYVTNGSKVAIAGGTFIGKGALNVSGSQNTLMSALARGKTYLLPDGTPVDFGAERKAFNFFTTEEERDDYDFVPSVQTITIGDAIYDLSDGSFSLILEDSVLPYTGDALTPEVFLIDSDGWWLDEGYDYTVTYANNVDVSDEPATVTVTGCGHYVGTLTAEFTIVSAPIENYTYMCSKPSYNGAEQTLELTVLTGSGKVLTEGVDYTFEIGASECILPGTYPVTVMGMGNYWGEHTFDWEIKPANMETSTVRPVIELLSVRKDVDRYIPAYSIQWGDHWLSEGIDYSVSAEKTFEPGEHTAQITFIGKYTGTLSAAYKIPKDVADVRIEVLPVVYTPVFYNDYYINLAQTPNIAVYDGDKLLTPDKDYTLYGDPHYLSQQRAGTYIARIDGLGDYCGMQRFEWSISPRDLSDGSYNLRLADDAETVYTGSEVCPDLILEDTNGKYLILSSDLDYYSFTVTYRNNVNVTTSTSLPAVATVTGQNDFCGSLQLGWEILPVSLDDGNFTLRLADSENPVYTGEEITPDMILTQKNVLLNPEQERAGDWVPEYGSKELDEGVDYTLTFENNIDAGTAIAKATGIGTYRGSLTAEFSIAPRDINDAVVECFDAEYDGTIQNPRVSVFLRGMELREGVDYYAYMGMAAVPYHAGPYSLVIEGCGNYCGMAFAGWNILPMDMTASDRKPTVEVTAFTECEDGFLPTFEIALGDLKLSQDTDFTVEAAPTFEDGEHTAVITFRGDYTGMMAVTYVNPIHIRSVKFSYDPMEYTGSPQTPTFVLRDGERELVLGTDYELVGELRPQTSTGSMPIKVRGLGDYAGETTFRWIISPVNISKCEVTVTPEQITYPEVPEVTVTYRGAVLKRGMDYTVELKENNGRPFLEITGRTNFVSSKNVYFTVLPCPIDRDGFRMLVEDADNLAYTGEELTPSVILENPYGQPLAEGADYILTYENNIDAGIATVTATGIGNYTGEMTEEFTIAPRDVFEVHFVAAPLVRYDGNVHYPKPTLGGDGRILIEGIDYVIEVRNSYGNIVQNPVDPGSYAVVILGMGNFCGELPTPWEIQPLAVFDFEKQPIVRLIGFEEVEGLYRPILEITVPEQEVYGVLMPERILQAGTDYDLPDPIRLEPGLSQIELIDFIGGYSGTIDIEYQIPYPMVLPASLKRIESEAFAGISAQAFEIPETVEYIAEDAFSGCDNLMYIINHSRLTIPAPEGVVVVNPEITVSFTF